MSTWQVIGATIFCRDCGYALDGLRTHECPECGRGFDPADPSTFYSKKTPGPIARWWLKQPGWLVFVLIAVPIGYQLWYQRLPYYYARGIAGFVVCGWSVSLYAGVTLIRVLIASEYGAWNEPRRRWRRDVAFLVGFIAVIVTIQFAVPMRIGLLTSMPRLNSIDACIPPNQDVAFEGSFRAGLYRFRSYRTESFGVGVCTFDHTSDPKRAVMFYLDDRTVGRGSGSAFFYYPGKLDLSGQGIVAGHAHVGHLYGNWYWYAWGYGWD